MKNIVTALSLLVSVTAFSQKIKNNADLRLFERTRAIQELADYDLSDRRYSDDTLNLTQEEKIRKDLTKEIREDILSKAIEGYEELITEFPKSKHIFRSLFYKGHAEFQLNHTVKAKETFLKALNIQTKEYFAMYKNTACKILAEIEMKNKNYREAVNYLDLTKKFPYSHFCGNAYAADEIYMAAMYSECYLGLNEYEKAYDILLPNIIENGLARNDRLVKIAFNAFLKNHTKEELKIQFENAFQNIITEKETRNKEEYDFYYIRFLNRKIPLNSWDFYGGFSSEEEMKKAANKMLTESGFYKLLTQ